MTVASVESSPTITGARQVKLCADVLLSSLPSSPSPPFDAIILPGGAKGAEHLSLSTPLISLLRDQSNAHRLYGAICASPALVLAQHDLLPARAVGHPQFADRLVRGGERVEGMGGARVVWDEESRCMTSVGPGSALEFALAVLGQLVGQEKVHEVAAPMTLSFTPTQVQHKL